ncbi:hypothetical protein [Streptomyces tauricus]|uniref:hypothetical protein n=1 Tax=Streptomyces tauricus TaxID=68274 RepID=UPI00341EBAF7
MLPARHTQCGAGEQSGVVAEPDAPRLDTSVQVFPEQDTELDTGLRVVQAAQFAQSFRQLGQQLKPPHTSEIAPGLAESRACLDRLSPMSRYTCWIDLRRQHDNSRLSRCP